MREYPVAFLSPELESVRGAKEDGSGPTAIDRRLEVDLSPP